MSVLFKRQYDAGYSIEMVKLQWYRMFMVFKFSYWKINLKLFPTNLNFSHKEYGKEALIEKVVEYLTHLFMLVKNDLKNAQLPGKQQEESYRI